MSGWTLAVQADISLPILHLTVKTWLFLPLCFNRVSTSKRSESLILLNYYSFETRPAYIPNPPASSLEIPCSILDIHRKRKHENEYTISNRRFRLNLFLPQFFKDLPGIFADFFLLEFIGPEVGIQRGLVELIHGFHAHQQFSPRGPTARQKWLHLIAVAINQAGADAQDLSGLSRRQPCVATGCDARRFGFENNTAVSHADHFSQHGNGHLPAPVWRHAACLRTILRHH